MNSTETRVTAIEELAQAICGVVGAALSERPDYRYMAQRLVDQGWSKRAVLNDEWPLTCACPCGECCESINPDSHCRGEKCDDFAAARRRRDAEIAARADCQHAAVLAGDESGVFGEFPPAVRAG